VPEPVFEIYEDKTREWRWRLKGADNEIIASSEGYRQKADCEDRIASVKKNSPIACYSSTLNKTQSQLLRCRSRIYVNCY
jgi:uncharacterized protein YegP (UPF0339 family)